MNSPQARCLAGKVFPGRTTGHLFAGWIRGRLSFFFRLNCLFHRADPVGQLATGRRDVSTPAETDEHREAGIPEDLLKGQDPVS